MYAIRSYYDRGEFLATVAGDGVDMAHQRGGQRPGNLFQAVVARDVAEAVVVGRITSYNVCYTKLLRMLASYYKRVGGG